MIGTTETIGGELYPLVKLVDPTAASAVRWVGQKAMAGSLPVALPNDQGTVAAPLGVRLSDGAAALIGQKAAAASVPVVLANDQNGATQASALFLQPRKLITYRAVYRLASRPYALSNAFGGAGRKQYATLHHTGAAAKLLKLRHAWVYLESASAAAIVMAELVRLTATTAPATGNPAITPTPYAPGDAAAEAVALSLPGTAGSEGALIAQAEWNLGITAAGSTVMPPPLLQPIDLLGLAGMASPDDEMKVPSARAATQEGFAITLDCSAAATIKGYIELEFTEE